MEINIINCFCTKEANSGNPAAIVDRFTANSNEKQKLAKELGMPVTVFLSEVINGSCHVEFFYPDTEMPLCLHGTIGAAYFLLQRYDIHNPVLIAKNENKLIIRNEDNIIQVLVSAQQAPKVILNKTVICKMLNLSDADQIENVLPLTVSSVGSPKFLVPVSSFALLAALNPNFDLITKWSVEHAVNGLYVYTKDSQDSALNFYARGFNPKTGHNEDAATGVAAAALALSLQQSIVVGQGIFIQRPSAINVSYENSQTIWVGGRAVFVSNLK